MRHAALLSSLFLVSIIGTAFAEDREPPSGRLPDGRAYRTDTEGNQLVDYIAELEVNNEALTRQVRGLQDELDEKQRALDRSGSGRVAPAFAEKDLLSAGSQKTTVASASLRDLPACPRCEACAPQTEVDCSSALRPVQDQLEQTRLNLEVERKQRSNSQSELQILVRKLQTDSDMKALELEKRGEELNSVRAELRTAEAEVQQAASRADAATSQMKRLEEEVRGLRSDREDAQTALRRASEKLSAAEAKASTQVAALKAAPRDSSPAKTRALESVRGSVLSEANSLRNLIANRDRLFAAYASKAHRVGLKPSAPVSSRQLSINSIVDGIRRAESVSEVMQLRGDVSEIRGRIQEDIALVSRMSRVQ